MPLRKQNAFIPANENEGKSFSDLARKQARKAGLILPFDGEVGSFVLRANHDEHSPTGILTWSLTSLRPSRSFDQWLGPQCERIAIGVCISIQWRNRPGFSPGSLTLSCDDVPHPRDSFKERHGVTRVEKSCQEHFRKLRTNAAGQVARATDLRNVLPSIGILNRGGSCVSRFWFACGVCIIVTTRCFADFSWVTWMQGGSSGGVSVTADHRGASYIIGDFRDTVSFGSNTLTSAGGSDIFVAKLNRKGNVCWAISVGGTNDDFANKILALPDGALFVILKLGTNASFGEATGLSGTFLARISTHGAVEWVRSLTNVWTGTAVLDGRRRLWCAGTQDGILSFSAWSEKGEEAAIIITDASGTTPSQIALDRKGAFYLSGRGLSSGFVTFGTNSVQASRRAITAKFDKTGRSQWAHAIDFRSTPSVVGLAVARDRSVSVAGNVEYGFSVYGGGPNQYGYPSPASFSAGYSPEGELRGVGIAGEYKGSHQLSGMTMDRRDRNFTVGSFSSSYVGRTPWYRGGFINGPGFSVIISGAYVSRVPGAAPYPIGTVAARAIAADAKGFAYVTGDFSGTALLGTNRIGTTFSGPSQAFVARLNDARRHR